MSEFSVPEVFPSIPLNDRNMREVRLGTAFVYFIQEGEDGPIKIGWAINPFQRLKQLQTGNADSLRLVYYEDLCDRRAAQLTETALHREFRGHRVRGEWFRPIGSVYRFVLHLHYGASVCDLLAPYQEQPDDEQPTEDEECEQVYQ